MTSMVLYNYVVIISRGLITKKIKWSQCIARLTHHCLQVIMTMLCAAEPTERGCSTSDGSITGCSYTNVNGVIHYSCQCAGSRCNKKVMAEGGRSIRSIGSQSKATITHAAAAMFAVVVIRSAWANSTLGKRQENWQRKWTYFVLPSGCSGTFKH